MAVYTETKTYHTKANMGMIDVTEDFQQAVTEACRKHGIYAGIITGFTTGGVAGRLTIGPWQNLTLVECDTRDRIRDIVFQVMGE